jgi:hypothetical protein
MDRHDHSIEQDLADALRRLNAAADVPPIDPAREAALMAAFDAARGTSPLPRRRDGWYLAAFAAAAAVLIAAGLPSALTGRHTPPPPGGFTATHTPPSTGDVQLEPPSDFIIVPGAAGLPRMESGTLVRMDLPVSMLPSLGVTPPAAGRATVVTADLIVAQDGLPRAVRLVN